VGRLTCRANQAEVQNQRLLTMALDVPPSTTFGAGGGGPFLTGGGGAGTSYDVSELRYETAFADNRTARVKVTGPLRLVSGVASQVLTMNSTVALTREQDQWRVCDRPNP
jgi:hypothetical protein